MVKVLLCTLIFLALVTGCGPQFYLPENQGKPAQIVVSAYTQNGCIEELQEEAKRRGVEVKLTNVETDLGWEIFWYPFYKGYKCTGDVTGPAKSTGNSFSPNPVSPRETNPITKTYASLVQYDGPKIKSGITLDALFMDDGSGSGEAFVSDIANANHVLKGAFVTIQPGTVDRPKPKILDQETLNKLQIFADRPWVIATFSSVDTVLECVFGETRPLGQKKGACRDNHGNRYWLLVTA
jgi:hypothetical protein